MECDFMRCNKSNNCSARNFRRIGRTINNLFSKCSKFGGADIRKNPSPEPEMEMYQT